MTQSRKKCSLSDCNNFVDSKGYCQKHYLRFRKYGCPHIGAKGSGTGRTSGYGAGRKFIEQLSLGVEDCIEWPLSKNDAGYGVVGGFETTLAHRASLIYHYGPPPESKSFACHKPAVCHNRSCVNPDHLLWSTPKENTSHRYIDKTIPFGVDSHASRLDTEQVIEIHASDLSISDLEAKYKVSRTAIYKIRSGDGWPHLGLGPRPFKPRSLSGFRGVSKLPNRDQWVAVVVHNKIKHRLGKYSCPEDAHNACVRKRLELGVTL